mgnify:CR=1 FL=1
MRPPQTPRNDLADNHWLYTWRWMRRQYAKLFFEHGFTGMVSYRGDPLYFELPSFDINPRQANDNQRK